VQDARKAESELVCRIVDDTVKALRQVGRLLEFHLEVPQVVGQDALIEELCMRQDTKVALLYGPSGMGKSVIARAVYNELQHEFQGRHYFVELSAGCDVALLQLNLVRAMFKVEVPYSSTKALRDYIATQLTGKKVLLLVDNVQSSDQLFDLLPEQLLLGGPSRSGGLLGSGSLVLLTSRLQSVLAPGLDVLVQEVEALEPPLEFHLFCLHAFGQLSLPVHLKDLESKLLDVVMRCMHVPKLLELAGKRASVLAATGDRSGMEEALRMLEREMATLSDGVLEPQKALYGQLPEACQELLLDIAVFLCGQPWHLVRAFGGRELDTLEERGFVYRKQAGDAWVVAMHDSVKELCLTVAGSAGEERLLQSADAVAACAHRDDEDFTV
jgi:hypothetical protein